MPRFAFDKPKRLGMNFKCINRKILSTIQQSTQSRFSHILTACTQKLTQSYFKAAEGHRPIALSSLTRSTAWSVHILANSGWYYAVWACPVIYTIKVRNQNSVKNYHETKRNTSQIKISFAHKFTSKMRRVCIIQLVRLAPNGWVGSLAR